MFDKPRILLLADKPGWSHHTVASSVSSRLSDDYAFEIAFTHEKPRIDPQRYDLVHVYFWGEGWHKRFVDDPTQVIKELSSHRWAMEPAYGPCDPQEAVLRHMRDAGTLAATSARLFSLFEPVHPRVRDYRLGIDPTLFRPKTARGSGPLRFGWAGNPKDPLKDLALLREAARQAGITLHEAVDLPFAEMQRFYEEIDVLLLSSRAEGTPLPVLEAMARGCYVVATDVGIVPEVIRDESEGLVVEGSIAAFVAAIGRVAARPDEVRAAGLANAERVARDRSWDNSARGFGRILADALAHREEARRLTVTAAAAGADADLRASGYDVHLREVNPHGYSDDAYRSAKIRFGEDVGGLLPSDKAARILEIGTGFGHFLRFLSERGYRRLTAVDRSSELLAGVRAHLGDRIERMEARDAASFLGDEEGSFDAIFLFDVIEHMSIEDAITTLSRARRALAPGGIVVMRTPNMANVLASYSRYIDVTHETGYTEQSLVDVLRKAGFTQTGVQEPRFGWRVGRACAFHANQILHRFLFRLQDRSEPTVFSKNIVVWGRV